MAAAPVGPLRRPIHITIVADENDGASPGGAGHASSVGPSRHSGSDRSV
jgi:hypothetical protein